MLHDETYAFIRLIFDRVAGQPMDLQQVKKIGPVAMKDWAVLQLELMKAGKTAVLPTRQYTDLFLG